MAHRSAHCPSTLAALLWALATVACAPAGLTPCNSDDDCLRRDLCLEGFCGAGARSEDAPGPTPSPSESVTDPGVAVEGTLTLVGVEPEGVGAPPEPEPEAPGEQPADWLDPGLLRRAVVSIVPVEGVVTAAVVDVPVLVTLDAVALGADFLAAVRERAVFATPQGEVLAAELDADAGDRMFYWVKATVDARPGLDAPQGFYLYAGGEALVVPPTPRSVWDEYFGVYHLGAARNVPQPDATGARAAVNDDAGAETVPCTVGACVFFDGNDDRLVVPSSFPELAGATRLTLSATVRLVSITDGFIAVWSTGERGRSRFYLATSASGVPQAAVRTHDAAPAVQVAQGGAALAPGSEHTLDAVLDMEAGTLSLYVDGQHRNTDSFATPGALPATASAAAAMGAAAGASAVYELDGRVDEVRISDLKRDPDWIRVDAASRAGRLTTVTLEP